MGTSRPKRGQMKKLILLALFLSGCATLNYKGIPTDYKGDKDVPRKPLYVSKGDVRFLMNSCVVVSTAVADRDLGLEEGKLQQEAYEKLAKDLQWTPNGTQITNEMDYFQKKGLQAPYDLYVMDSCYAYSYTAEQLLKGCSAVLFYVPADNSISHVETVVGVSVQDENKCEFYTNSWGEYATIMGFSGINVIHSRMSDYRKPGTKMFAFYICPKNLGN